MVEQERRTSPSLEGPAPRIPSTVSETGLGQRHPVRSMERSSSGQPEDSLQSAADLPAYVFSSPIAISDGALTSKNHKLVQDYVAHWIRNPDKGSAFDKATRLVRWLPDRALFGLMRMLKYDGLLFTQPGEVVAHTFCQRHGSDLHMFSVSVNPSYRGQGLAKKALQAFIEYGRNLDGIERIRLGAGGHVAVQSICEKLEVRGEEFGLRAEGDQFFRYFSQDTSS